MRDNKTLADQGSKFIGSKNQNKSKWATDGAEQDANVANRFVIVGKKKTDSAKASLLGDNEDDDDGGDDFENIPGQNGGRKA